MMASQKIEGVHNNWLDGRPFTSTFAAIVRLPAASYRFHNLGLNRLWSKTNTMDRERAYLVISLGTVLVE